MLVWRQHPTAIEADLGDRGFDVLDWHAGRMSSRRLLVLLRHAPDDGPYNKALREGRWPPFVAMLAEIHKEIALYRAAKYVETENKYVPNVFTDPVDRAKVEAEIVADEQAVEDFETDLSEQMGWT